MDSVVDSKKTQDYYQAKIVYQSLGTPLTKRAKTLHLEIAHCSTLKVGR